MPSVISGDANVSATEFGYLDGVTSALQTQMDAKAPLASPTFTGTVALPSGTTLAGSTLTSGKIVQVVNGTTATQATSSSNVLADTGLSVTITPTSASNSILVFVSQNGVTKETNNTGCKIELLRGATSIALLSSAAGYTNSNAVNAGFAVTSTYLDSPATTSATTYKTQFLSTANNALVLVQWQSARSTITAMEIAS